MGILEFLKKSIKNEKTDIKPEMKIENKKEIVYDKMIEVTHTNTEGRQKLIKQLIKNDEFLNGNEYFQDDLICCDADIEDGEMPSGKK